MRLSCGSAPNRRIAREVRVRNIHRRFLSARKKSRRPALTLMASVATGVRTFGGSLRLKDQRKRREKPKSSTPPSSSHVSTTEADVATSREISRPGLERSPPNARPNFHTTWPARKIGTHEGRNENVEHQLRSVDHGRRESHTYSRDKPDAPAWTLP